MSKHIASLIAAPLVALLVVWLVPRAGLGPSGPAVLGIIALTVILWAFSSMENAAATFLMLGLLTLVGIPASQIMSGFASGAFWILLTVLYYGFAMSKSGLPNRISFMVLNLFHPSYGSILFSLLIIGTLLSLGIPSMTVRTAIMVPFAWGLVQAIGLAPGSSGAALIILSTIEMAVLPGVAFLYGSLWGPLVEGLFRSSHLPISWLGYSRALTLPTLAWCVGLLAANLWMFSPKEKLRLDPEFLRSKLRAMGPWKKSEIIMGLIVAASIVFWALDSRHGLPAYTPGLIAVPIMSLTGILTPVEFSTGIPWPLLIFLGGVFSLITVLEQNQIPVWIAHYLIPVIGPVLGSRVLLVVLIAAGMMTIRFVDPSGFPTLTAVFLSLHVLLMNAGISPLVFAGIMVMAGHPFWVAYQNVWVVLSEGLTSGKAFTGRQRIAFATVYGAVTLLTVAISTVYWRWLGYL